MDPLVVETLHPAVVVHTPARARDQRLSLVALRTPVAIPRLREGEIERFDGSDLGGTAFADYAFARHGGGLWRPVVALDANVSPVGVRADMLAAYLSGDPDAPLDLWPTFMGTPVAAWGQGRVRDVAYPSSPGCRGVPVDVDGSRAVARDDRDRARAAVAGHLGRRFAVVGDEVWERLVPTLVLYPNGMREVETEHRFVHGLGLVASPASRAAAEGILAFPPGKEAEADVEALAGLGLDAEIDARVPRVVLDQLAGFVRLALDARLAEAGARPIDEDRGAALRARVRSLELDALTGLADGDDPLPGLGVLEEGLRFALGGGGYAHELFDGRKSLRHLKDHYLPEAERVFASDRHEDFEALAGVCP